MNTSQIKNFATQSRNILKTGVIQRIQILGFDANGNLTKGEPTRIDIQGGATLFAGEIFDGAFYDRWMSLRRRIQEKGVKEVYEEAAYTWFNRLVAIRIMQKNGFIDPVLAYTNEQTRIPRIVAEARAGRVGQMAPADREKLRDLMGDDARINEQFAILIENFCHNNAVIFNCFGGIEEYIALLLPDNILAPGGFIDLLNHTSYITDEDFKQSELIGWLYQFYISEKKDEVFDGFKKGKKAEAEDIPAATQIFTPNWIVKYMVQNTLGRIYLDNNPYSGIKAEMEYLVEQTQPTPNEAILKIDDLADYKLLDPASGSGHILLEGFDLLYKMYIEEAYSSRVAIESIFQKNIIGIDIDTRAKQLATFALIMKAAHIDQSFLDCKVMPRVLDMPNSSFSRPLTELLREFYMSDERSIIEETYDAFELLQQAHNLGSIMRFDLSERTRKLMLLRFREWKEASLQANSKEAGAAEILKSIELILALSDSYTSTVANPPYMGNGNMNDSLKAYINSHYPSSKTDLFSVFIERMLSLVTEKGRMGCITMESWMFLSSFEGLRDKIIDDYYISSISHFGWYIIGIAFGTAMSVIQKYSSLNREGVYSYLTMDGIDREKNIPILFPIKDNGRYSICRQERFYNIPGHLIGYWLSDRVIDVFGSGEKLKIKGDTRQGMATSDNNRFLRLWPEVSITRIGFGLGNAEEALEACKKWYPYNKGGAFHKWYGNQDYVINYENDGEEVKGYAQSLYKSVTRTIKSISEYFKPCISWSKVTSSAIAFRYYPEGFIFDVAGCCVFFKSEDYRYYYLGLLNSRVVKQLLGVLSPTLNFEAGHIASLPVIVSNLDEINSIVKSQIDISKLDWDAHETSWDFKENELIRIYKENHSPDVNMDANQLKDIVTLYKEYWAGQFNQLHSNEEELNRQFIDIYGLQDELTPDVPLDEITILQQGEISVEDGKLVWHNDVLAKQLLSYAIGCMMGRYRLDRSGMHIAYPNPSAADIEAYDFKGEKFEIDDDGIIPLLSRDCPFDDNAYNRVVKFIRQVFGESFLNENLNFIEEALGKTIENYFVKDFWKEHKKMYSNRPIYWLFSSKKGAFQCLTYMHRMNPYTAEVVRSKYLLPYIDFLKNKIAADMERASSLSTVERKNLDKMQAALDECLEYEERLHDMADRQVRFDLDDGVVKNYALFGDVLAPIK